MTSSRFRTRIHAFLCYVLATGAVLTADLMGQIASAPTGSSASATISGKVINASTGMPVSRALVRFNDRAMLTGHDGNFEFDEVMDSAGNLQVIKPGFYFSIDQGGPNGTFLRLNQKLPPLELRLYPEAIFTGTVTGPNGDPLPHIIVTARRSFFNEEGHRWIPAAQAQTDSRGRFRLPVPAGDYKLESMYVARVRGTNQVALPVIVPSKSSSNSSDLIHIRSGEEQNFELHPSTSRAYTVTVTFDANFARGFPRITARSSKGVTIPMPVNMSRPGGPGGSRLELPSGTYKLTADIMSPDGAQQGETTVTVTDHDISGVVFHLSPLPVLPVELFVDGDSTSDNGQPSLPQLGLSLENIDSDFDVFRSTIRLTARQDRTLGFVVPPGSYRLRARGGGQWYVKSADYGASDLLQQNLVIGPGTGGTPIRITVSNQTGSLEGMCKLAGIPTVCTVYLVPSASGTQSVFTLQSNSQGVYSSKYLPPGTYQAIAFEQRHSADYSDPATLVPFASRVRTVTINAGEKPTLDLDEVSTAEMIP